jgi:lactoylglutathione lyase
MGLFAKDMAKTCQFYEDFLGYRELFTIARTHITYIRINDQQGLEIYDAPDRGEGQLNHIAFYTDNADKMREYLISKGVQVPEVGTGSVGNKTFKFSDPDGHIVEMVESQPDSLTSRETGKSMPATRISTHMMHLGVLVGDLDKSVKFYNGILGFKEFWRGNPSPKVLSWVDMRVSDGDDYLEFMLYDKLPVPGNRGGENHMSLMVPDAQKAVDELHKRAAGGLYDKEIAIKIGVNRKRQVNLFDPDGTRVELMEPKEIDGHPVPSSTAPPPR